jgi:serine/threonine-protein kinase
MPASPDETTGESARARVLALRGAFDTIIRLPAGERRARAVREFASDPDLLRELLHLLERTDAPPLFLAPPSARTVEAQIEAPPLGARGRVIAHRWRLVRPIGSGSQGVLWEAYDAVGRGRVAVKLMRPSASVEAFHRESAALRWLRLPGVVRLLDEGKADGCCWLAMAFVDGKSFPGRGAAGRWERVEPVATGLLETLARIHGAGVVHGDLKPNNVLVDARGVVTVLDLGLATAAAGGPLRRGLGGTPGYAAPEQYGGQPPDARSDLYSVGVLLVESILGRRPRGGGGRLPALPGVPPRVRNLISRLLSPDPRLRPASAAEALEALRVRPAALRTRPYSERELRGRFRGHDWFHHIREDAARELFRRTLGDPARVEAELGSWMRAGLAHLEGELVAVDRLALDRLPDLPRSTGRPLAGVRRRRRIEADTELTLALRAGEPRRVVEAATKAGRVALAEGRGVHAVSALEFGAAAAQELGAKALHPVLLLAAWAALGTAIAREIERALWLVQRSNLADDHATALEGALRAAAANQAGDHRSAWRAAARATRDSPPEIQLIAWSVRALIAQSLDIEVQRRTVAEATRWARRARTGAARRASRTWKAWLLYREGRCADAARLHLEAVQTAETRAESLRRLTDAAVAAKDAGNSRAAIGMAAVARRRAATLRLPVREARAYFTEREARLVGGSKLRPNLAALAAVDDLGFSVLSWNSRMTESVIAWKLGRADVARAILAPLPIDGDASRLALHELPVACLAAALGSPCGRSRARSIARRAVREASPPLAVQCLALLAMADDADREALRGLARRLRLPARGREHVRMREVFSVREALAILDSAG